MDLDLDSLAAAVTAEDRDVDLSGAVLRSGWESVVLETRDGWILRFPRPHVAFEREVALLRRLDGRLPVPIPHVEWTGRHTPFAAYRKLEGRAFDHADYLRTSARRRNALAGSLARFLAAMHTSLTPTEADELAIPRPDDATSAVAGIAAQLDRVPPGARRGVEELLDEVRSLWMDGTTRAPLVVLHNDFHFGNMVLSEPVGEVVGVWDFSCVKRGEPSSDLRYLAGESPDLLRRVAKEYERLTGQRVDERAATVGNRLEVVSDALELDQTKTLLAVVPGWESADAELARADRR